MSIVPDAGETPALQIKAGIVDDQEFADATVAEL
jgi:hypothetical protein